MGHDITAYLGTADPAGPEEPFDNWDERTEVAYLRRNAFSPLRHTLYEVLDARRFDGDVSGIGAARWFARDRLLAASQELFQRLAMGQEVQPELDFVQACLAARPPDRASVYISFG